MNLKGVPMSKPDTIDTSVFEDELKDEIRKSIHERGKVDWDEVHGIASNYRYGDADNAYIEKMVNSVAEAMAQETEELAARTTEIRLEDRARKKLAREGFLLRKSRLTGGFMIVDGGTNTVVTGGHPFSYALDLDDVVAFAYE